jgi:hypothetical protein
MKSFVLKAIWRSTLLMVLAQVVFPEASVARISVNHSENEP